MAIVTCDQCEAMMIQGVFCHETGCPNAGSRYDVDSGEWIKQRECFECGCTVDKDDPCCSEQDFQTDDRDSLCPECGKDDCTCQQDWANGVNEALGVDR